MQVLYTAEATATGDGRNGHVATSDGSFEFDLAVPKEMGGGGGKTNPEQLFAAGYAACFHNAMLFVARSEKLDMTGSTVEADVAIGPNESGGFTLGVTLQVSVPSLDADKARELVDKAHQVCPYSNATRGNIPVDLTLV